MKIALVFVGKTNEKYLSEGIDIYSGRVARYCGFEIITVQDIKNTRNMSETEQKNREGKKIIDTIGKGDYCVLLDEKGSRFSTKEFAGWIENRMILSPRRVVFVTGGAYGFSDEVYARSDFKISLSNMTFPHQLVRLLFLEQLYRVFSVIKGEPYHHE